MFGFIPKNFLVCPFWEEEMPFVCGVDGCRKGWIVICKEMESSSVSPHLCSSAQAFFDFRPSLVAIDIPIGLPERGSRMCDVEARKLLGPARKSSIFPAPIRPILNAKNYKEACAIRLQFEGKKLSLQTWGIVPKIKEVDKLLRENPHLRNSIREVHPEVSFYFLGGNKPLQLNKKTKDGQMERYALLKPIFGHWLDQVLSQRNQLGSGVDDVLDAFAALWSAERIFKGESQSLPSLPVADSFGLRMEILA